MGYLYSSYLILWLNSFTWTGYIENEKEVEMVYSRMTLVAMPSSVLLTVLIGYLADRVKPVYLIAPGFFGRACVSFLFKTKTYL